MMGNPIFKGDRVAIQPHSDIFMMGECFGEVLTIGRKWIQVKGERSGRVFKFYKHGDSLETTAPRVTVNQEQRLFVIRFSDGVTCLGFDVCHERLGKYSDWLARRNIQPREDWTDSRYIGTLGQFGSYERASAAIKAHYDKTGERCDCELTPQLLGLEGKRVEVVDSYGETRRFTVGKSTGWIPIHLELARGADGGGPAYGAPYSSVRVI